MSFNLIVSERFFLVKTFTRNSSSSTWKAYSFLQRIINFHFQILRLLRQRSPHVSCLLVKVLEMVSVQWQKIIPLVCCRNYCQLYFSPQSKCSTHLPIFSSSVPTHFADYSELLEMHRCFSQYDIDLHLVGGNVFSCLSASSLSTMLFKVLHNSPYQLCSDRPSGLFLQFYVHWKVYKLCSPWSLNSQSTL